MTLKVFWTAHQMNKGMKELLLVTKCICHKGFSGYSSIVARSKFRVGGQETTPQSLTAHTLVRCSTFKMTRHEQTREPPNFYFDSS